jgi:hypothetical protein
MLLGGTAAKKRGTGKDLIAAQRCRLVISPYIMCRVSAQFYRLSCCKTQSAPAQSLYSDDAVELLLLRLTEWLRLPWCRRLCRWLPSLAGRPWTTPLRASMPPFTEKLRHTMKARMAAFSWANPSDSYARSVWYSRPLTSTRQVNPDEFRYVS